MGIPYIRVYAILLTVSTFPVKHNDINFRRHSLVSSDIFTASNYILIVSAANKTCAQKTTTLYQN